ncbi:glycosyltransferase family 39 protein [Paenibacillus alginolyticus]|uniref:Glycosyltransferase family 39 protein n=1 Tax=Paenibacillus alginolyticus TaxID=59839 RepID=A0ABT4G9D3_9BACL|nr:glycosyltransferase family 39 protein [Paenibacillus alginolyticus]MCY9692739.1 glycosyltransferase family 39 protein [Paenibacillus alginolyticus]MEC0146396.1 glycosyltransferase family 39 protein [Paenibacillus alginolyticus]
MVSWFKQLWGAPHKFFLLGLLLLTALLLRLYLAPLWMGYDTDVRTFLAWSDRAYTVGLSGLYTNAKDYFLDYPPGYMYVLYLVGLLHHKLSIPWESAGSLVILKLPAILADIVTAYLLFQLAISRQAGARTWIQAILIAALFAFNPAIWSNSAIWGQVDSFFMLFILATLLLQQRGKLPQAAVFIALALLLKPQALLFGIFLLIDVIRKRSMMVLLLSVLSGAATMAVISLPFAVGRGYGWLIGLYSGTLASYPYASLNAFNLMALLGGNFIDMNSKFLHISYQWIGWVLMALSIVYVCYLYIRSKDQRGALLYVAFLFITAVFICMTKMHERYLHYGLLLALTSFIYIKDRRILWLFIGFSITHFINMADVLLRSFHQDYHIPRYDLLMLVVSAINVMMFAYACLLGWRLFVESQQEQKVEEPVPLPTEQEIDAEIHTESERWKAIFKPSRDEVERSTKGRFFTKKDALYLGALVLVYTIIALFHLGGHKAPTTFWKPTSAGETVIADLGSSHNITRINTFAGVGEGAYSFWFSQDGKQWQDQISVKSDHTKVFTWNTVEPNKDARYVKMVMDAQEGAALHLHEIGIFGDGSTAILPIAKLSEQDVNAADEGTTANLFDEPATVPYTPTYMNGSYFDEIYHARTAYEHLHQIEPYESTHPPLGKVLMSIGIYVFGLNPFGWRIIGTLFGVGMIPIMYVFAKRMFGRSEYAFIAAFLLTFDFMHFAQTRIATIDVYGVFFIMLMFYFMYRYTTLSFYREKLWTTLIPLGLSGLFFGIGAASKWIVIYGGAGLAVLLLLSLLERFGEYRFARNLLRKVEIEPPLSEPEHTRLQLVEKLFVRNTLLTLLWCVLTFIIIPLGVYTLSYIPFMMVPGPGHNLKDVVTYQVHMYKYHKDLVATHPFSSPWWEWPMMLRPIWYYQAKLMPQGMLSSIVSFGNPLVWWPGFIAVILSFYVAVTRKDKRLRMLLIAYCSQYLPWILVPRLTFIYHYFAMVPFLVLILTYYIKEYLEEGPLHKKRWVYGYLIAVFVLFVLFYPILSGMIIPSKYSFFLRWLPGWNFF